MAEIFKELKERYDFLVQKYGEDHILGIFLYGSQNYQLDTPNSDIDTKPLLNVATHISDEYVYEDDLKIEIHRKINEINSLESLKLVKSELEDRFGRLSEDVIIYMYEEWFEKLKNM